MTLGGASDPGILVEAQPSRSRRVNKSPIVDLVLLPPALVQQTFIFNICERAWARSVQPPAHLKDLQIMDVKPFTKAAFPIPPPFYQHFTKANIAQLRQIRKEKSAAEATEVGEQTITDSSKQIDRQTLPQNLRYLVPPELPTDGKWRTFGAQHDLHAPDPSLEDAGIEVLFPSDPAVKLNPQPYLLSLARSLLTTFLSLTGIMSEDPTQYEETITDLRTIMTNMHDLINQYRPHQARETLILMMEERIEKLRGEIRGIGEAGEKMEGAFKELCEAGESKGKLESSGHTEKVANQNAGGLEKQRQRAAWEALRAVNFDGSDNKDDET
jgi:mediator of RNA polymerase II transcription subunit 7